MIVVDYLHVVDEEAVAPSAPNMERKRGVTYAGVRCLADVTKAFELPLPEDRPLYPKLRPSGRRFDQETRETMESGPLPH